MNIVIQESTDQDWLLRFRAALAANPKMRRAEESLEIFHRLNPAPILRNPAAFSPGDLPAFCRRQAQ